MIPSGLVVASSVVLLVAACAGARPAGVETDPTDLEATATAAPTPTPDPTPTETPEPEESPSAPPSPEVDPALATVDVVTTWSQVDPADGSLQVSAYVAVVEATGTCTLRLTGPDGRTASATTSAIADATTTSCGVLTIPASQLVPGRWEGTVSYSSPSSTGSVAAPATDVP